jgi:glycosyltransferase involved in cell wall biosynthesis
MSKTHFQRTNKVTSGKGGAALSAVVVSYHLLADSTRRPHFVARALGKMALIGRVSLMASNFDHVSKRTIPTDEAVRVPVRPYATNISIGRVLSYFDFAGQVNHVLQEAEADLVYICVPDYISALAILRNKRDRRLVVIVDVVDLWPEAFPLPKLINGLFKDVCGFIFKPLRRWLFQKADLVLFQSSYFLKQFGKDSSHYGFLPMCLSGKAALSMDGLRTSIREEIRILFLGSLNNITDTESLITMLNLIARQRKVCLTVLGGGHGLSKLEKRLANTTVRLIVRGITFDQRVREEELTQAHFGFNGYKETTEVSVSYKSLDYLQNGLPVINCTKGDFTDLVSKSGCGLNYEPGKINEAVEKILSFSDYDQRKMRENASRAFEENYSYEHFRATLAGYIEGLLVSDPSRDT